MAPTVSMAGSRDWILGLLEPQSDSSFAQSFEQGARWLRSRFGSGIDAEGLLQDTTVVVRDELKSRTDILNPQGYFRVALLNRARKDVKDKARIVSIDDHERQEAGPAKVYPSLVADSQRPTQAAFSLAVRAASVLALRNHRDASVIVAIFVGTSIDEVARLYGITADLAYQIWHRFKQDCSSLQKSTNPILSDSEPNLRARRLRRSCVSVWTGDRIRDRCPEGVRRQPGDISFQELMLGRNTFEGLLPRIPKPPAHLLIRVWANVEPRRVEAELDRHLEATRAADLSFRDLVTDSIMRVRSAQAPDATPVYSHPAETPERLQRPLSRDLEDSLVAQFVAVFGRLLEMAM